jgi:hypothetical protein
MHMAADGEGGLEPSSGLRELISTGFHRSHSWMHLIAVFFAFASDFVKPLLPYLTGLLVGISFGLFLLIWVLIKFRRFRNETLAAAAIFFLITAILSVVVLVIQKAEGNPEEGAAAHSIPGIIELQQKLDIIDTRTIRIEANTNKIIAILQPKPHPSTILQHIAGVWGEKDCSKVTYRFSRVENALTIESAKRPSGTKPYKFVGTIIGDKDTTMEVRGEAPEAAQGLAATFEYESSGNGQIQRLHWQDRVANGTDVELNRCE